MDHRDGQPALTARVKHCLPHKRVLFADEALNAWGTARELVGSRCFTEQTIPRRQ